MAPGIPGFQPDDPLSGAPYTPPPPSTPPSPDSGTTPPGTPAAPPSAVPPVSYESDPVLARIRALGQQNVANAETEALALRKRAILESGFGDIASELGLDPSIIQAANENPFSLRQTLMRNTQERGRQLDNSLNQGNLFFSGARANQLGDLERSRAEAEAQAMSGLRGLLGQIDQGVLTARTRAAEEETEALELIAAEQRRAAMEKAQMDALAAILGGTMPGAPSTSTLPWENDPLYAGINFNIDPYEEDLRLALAQNPIFGTMGQF